MSVWASICGDDPKFYTEGYGYDDTSEGFLDVAVSCVADRVRIICRSMEDGEIIVDPGGLIELHRRIVAAGLQLEGRSR